MKNDLIVDQFIDIEEKVGFLIKLCKELKEENRGLKQKIVDLEKDKSLLMQKDSENSEQKKIIQEKVSALILKLADFDRLS